MQEPLLILAVRFSYACLKTRGHKRWTEWLIKQDRSPSNLTKLGVPNTSFTSICLNPGFNLIANRMRHVKTKRSFNVDTLLR